MCTRVKGKKNRKRKMFKSDAHKYIRKKNKCKESETLRFFHQVKKKGGQRGKVHAAQLIVRN